MFPPLSIPHKRRRTVLPLLELCEIDLDCSSSSDSMTVSPITRAYARTESGESQDIEIVRGFYSDDDRIAIIRGPGSEEAKDRIQGRNYELRDLKKQKYQTIRDSSDLSLSLMAS